MGWKDADWAYTLQLPTSQQAVVAAIAHVTDDKTHQTYVSQAKIAAMVSMSVATVNRAVGVLQQQGVLSRVRRHGVGGYRTTDIIILNTTTYMTDANVGETHVGETNVGLSGDLHDSDAPPTSRSARAEEITQKITQIDHPDLIRIASFEEFWSIWPRKESKKDALKAWRQIRPAAVAPAGLPGVIAAARAYAESPYRPERQFVPYAATWLRAERWNDPPPAPPEAQRRETPGDRARTALELGRSMDLATTQNGIAS